MYYLFFTYFYIIIFISMGIKVRVRLCGNSLVITLSAQVAKLHNIARGNTLEILPIGKGEFRIRKA